MRFVPRAKATVHIRCRSNPDKAKYIRLIRRNLFKTLSTSLCNFQLFVECHCFNHVPVYFLLEMAYLLECVDVTVLTDNIECDAWIIKHVYEAKVTALGFDTESRISWGDHDKDDKGVAIVQICAAAQVLIFRVYQMKRADLPVEFVRLMEDEKVSKYCVDTRGDIEELESIGCLAKGLVDVQVVEMAQHGGRARSSMKDMVCRYTDYEMEKNKTVRTSNWSNTLLTIKQIEYAACDALLSLVLAQALNITPKTKLFQFVCNFAHLPDYEKLGPLDCKGGNVGVLIREMQQELKSTPTKALPVSNLINTNRLKRIFASVADILSAAQADKKSRFCVKDGIIALV